MLKPLFRWAGAKTKMKKKYGDLFWPVQDYDVFVDVFGGTCCVAMWVYNNNKDVQIIVNDNNTDIINIYNSIKNNYECFKYHLDIYDREYIQCSYEGRRKYFYSKRDYHGWEYDNIDPCERAALLYGLLKTSFNGIWQLNNNTNGKFGTPVGLCNEKDSIYNEEDLLDFKQFTNNVQFTNTDFKQTQQYFTNNTFVYLDPPYRDSHTNYSKDGFTDSDQTDLCNMMNSIDSKGGIVSMSNKYNFDNFFEDRLTDSFTIDLFDVKYTAGRGVKDKEKIKVVECFIRNYEHKESTNLVDFFE